MDNPVDKVDNSADCSKFSHNGPIIGLFAKQPEPGRVKTRMTPPLSAEQACRLYQVALQETAERLSAAQLPLAICYAGCRDWFSAAFPGIPLLAQVGDDLGARMDNAMQALFSSGAGPVLLTGSDCPDLPLALLAQLLQKLRRVDVGFVPCRDGGYAAIGLRRPVPGLFAEIPWSSSGVMTASRRRCRQLGLVRFETAGWYDLDNPDDLRQLVQRSPGSRTAGHIVGELGDLLE